MRSVKIRALSALAALPLLSAAGCWLPGGQPPGPVFEQTLDLPATVSGTLDSSNPTDSYRFNLAHTASGILFVGDCPAGMTYESGSLEAGGSGGGDCNPDSGDGGWSITEDAEHGYLIVTLAPGQTGPLSYSFAVNEAEH